MSDKRLVLVVKCQTVGASRVLQSHNSNSPCHKPCGGWLHLMGKSTMSISLNEPKVAWISKESGCRSNAQTKSCVLHG